MYTILKYILSALIITGFLSGCADVKKDQKAEGPAKMSNPGKESDINTLTLQPEAVKRLGIETTVADTGEVNLSRVYSAEVMSVPGQTVSLTAPVAGTLMNAAAAVTAGKRLQKGDPMYRLLILPSEKDLLGAGEDVTRLERQYEVSRLKVERADQLLKEKAGSLRAKQEAEAELAGITASLRVAKARAQLLQGNTTAEVTGRLSSLTLRSPISGTVQKVYGSAGQVVAAAAPIADIAATDKLWVRVPLYAGDIDKVDRGVDADILLLSGFSGSTGGLTGRVVKGPQTADPLNTSVDLYYEVDNGKGLLSPGSRVSARLPLKGSKTGLIIPYPAIVYDVQGGAWVYLADAGLQNFVRQRVEIESVSGNKAVIRRGLKGKEKLVTQGAAELFGFEFGGGK